MRAIAASAARGRVGVLGRMCGRVLCACFSRACGRGGVWFARFLVVFRLVLGVFFGGCFGVV